MPYYVINNQPVFLSSTRYKELKELVSKDKSPEWRVSSTIEGSEASKELSELMYDRLYKIHCEDSEHFRFHWINFDLNGNDAAENTWNLLYDYCHYYGYAYLSDLRDFPEKLTSNYQGESYAHPMGKVFAFNHTVKPKKWWWRITHKMKRRIIRIIVNVEKVSRLKGNLKRFELYSDYL